MAEIAGQRLRLRVDLDQRDVVELNPDAAARLPLAFGGGFTAQVGRVALPGRQARARLTLAGRTADVIVSEHGRPCCGDGDGALSPTLLPWRSIRFVRRDAPAMPSERSVTLDETEGEGLSFAAAPDLPIRIQLSLTQPRTVATAAGGARLAARFGGRLAGQVFALPGPFGTSRSARRLELARPALVAGFGIASLPVRIADYRGSTALPAEPARAGDIAVRRRVPRQREWPLVTLGRDRLSACAEIRLDLVTRALTLRCAFAGR